MYSTRGAQVLLSYVVVYPVVEGCCGAGVMRSLRVVGAGRVAGADGVSWLLPGRDVVSEDVLEVVDPVLLRFPSW